MKIYLVGMPGSGKSTLGKQVANELLLPFVDLDKEIEQREQKSIPDIFTEKGEDYFRLIEAEVLRQYTSSNDSFILATGGGAPCFYDGISILNSTGLTIFLDVGVEELAQRVSKKTNRPLLQNDKDHDLSSKIAALLEKRRDVYKQAKLTIKNPTLASLLEKIKIRK
jgi:shikimate kinase